MIIKYKRQQVNYELGVEHRRKIEKILGKSLPDSVRVHHRNRDGMNNENLNLIVCENQSYHKFIHMREDAYRATGNVNFRKCVRCKKYDDPRNMSLRIDYRNNKYADSYSHKTCEAARQKEIRRRKNESIS